MTAYYNEFDPAAAAVLRQLIADGVIADGVVDDRSIKEVKTDDLRNFSQVHLFAGGGLWSVAARLAGWPDDRPLWTGSCPCQPFSQAGKRAGAADERHLWPDFFRLIRAGRPPVVVGEQVAGAAGYDWFNGVRADLASEGYQSRVVDIPAATVDAPNIRQRLYWVAVDDSISDGPRGRTIEARSVAAADGGNVGDTAGAGRQQGQGRPEVTRHGDQSAATHCRDGSFWSDSEWLICHDGKARRTKSRLRHVVDGISARMDSLCRSRGYSDEEAEAIRAVLSPELLVPSMPGRIDLWKITGNAINPQLAAHVLAALMEVKNGNR